MANFIAPIMLAGSVVSAVGASQSAAAQQNAALYNARLEEINAMTAADQSAVEVSRFERARRQELGSIRAAFGATGNTEDALSVLADVEMTSQLDKAALKYQGDLRVIGHRQNAQLNRMAADTAAREGGFRTASAFLSGLGNVAAYGAASGGTLSRSPAGGISKGFLE